jgi:hypothetical protein
VNEFAHSFFTVRTENSLFNDIFRLFINKKNFIDDNINRKESTNFTCRVKFFSK